MILAFIMNSRVHTLMTASIFLKQTRNSRQISCSSCFCNRNREARMLMKMLSSNEERKLWNIKPQTCKSFIKMEGKRASVLNKMLMVNVSEAMISGDFDDVLENRGLQITKVSIDKSNRLAYVYWVAKDDEDPLEVQGILDGLSGLVRQKLLYSNVGGRVPEIRFKRDIQLEQYEVTMNALRNLQLSSPENFEVNEEPCSTSIPFHEDVFVMRQDTLGLLHSKILTRILNAKLRCYPLNPPIPPSNLINETHFSKENENNSEVSSQHLKYNAVKNFIIQQKKSLLSRNCTRREYLQPDENYYDENDDEFYDSIDRPNFQETDEESDSCSQR